ncbi:MAG: SCO family protein [Candidatus Eremiobacteraeota bacterium]|nr:SCO family protein [Candidatus Eremiobacteraeota bacterium]
MLRRVSLAIALAALFCTGAVAASGPQPRLQDQTGRIFTLDTLHGEPVVLTFIATHCTDACPLINAQFAQVSHDLSVDHVRVHLLSITLDPENDPPARMRAVAKQFDANAQNWQLATGSPSQVHRIMRAYNVLAQHDRKGYADVHTTYIYLIDRHGKLAKTILASTNFSADLFHELSVDWNRLMR